MAREEFMPQKSLGLLKLIAKERSRQKSVRGVEKSSLSLPSGLLDYVDLPAVDPDEPTKITSEKKKSRRHACHPVVIFGLLTVIVYIIFMTFLIGYFHVPKIKAVVDSLKRLENIKEWLRIIFKPWYNGEGKDRSALAGEGSRIDDDKEEPPSVGPRLNPEFDVKLDY